MVFRESDNLEMWGIYYYWGGGEKMSRKNGQFHVHEVVGSTRIAGRDPHNHRFAGVSGQAIPVKGGHVHEVAARTDFFEDHFHEFEGFSGLQIPVGNGRHVHFVRAKTTCNDGHRHKLIVASLIDDPIGEDD